MYELKWKKPLDGSWISVSFCCERERAEMDAASDKVAIVLFEKKNPIYLSMWFVFAWSI